MSRLTREQETIKFMIDIYCKHHHKQKDLCEECDSLWQYAISRLDKCTFGEDKPVCVKCPIHCYKPGMRDHIKTVMRFSGPRMLLHHPYLACMHLFVDSRKKNGEL